MKKKLLLIIMLATVLRFWKLDEIPALNADEATIGYNAYSLLQTGLDEHGNSWPVHFQSFNDFKPGLFFYLVLPFVKILGLSIWAVRVPGAVLGILTVLAVYLLVKELFKDKNLALVSAFFLAISPWHIHFSRGGWEVNSATFFITVGIWLFVKGLHLRISSKKLHKERFYNPEYLVLSSLFFVAALYSYHAARIIVPLIGLSLIVIYRKRLLRRLSAVVLAGTIGVMLLIPLAKDLASPAGFSRAAGVGLFADPGPLNRINEQRGEHSDLNSIKSIIVHNKAVNYTLDFLENWGEHYWGEFLFLSGDDIQRDKVPEFGQAYIYGIVLLILGLVAIVKDKSHRLAWLFVVSWFVIAPVASALTFQSPHALRAHNMVIPLTIISAFGLLSLIAWLRRNIRVKLILHTTYYTLLVIILLEFSRYLHQYWVHMSKEYPFSSQYGVPELVNFIDREKQNYEKIIVTDRYDQPYILFLFYMMYPPDKFQAGHELTPRDQFGFSTVRSFDKFEFKSINFDEMRPNNPKSLIIGTDEEIPDEANVIKRIYGSNGYLYFEVVEN